VVNSKPALIIGTEVATNGFESGASLRLNSIRDLVISAGFEVTVVSRKEADLALANRWELVVLASFATAKFLRKARKQAESLWFDSTDSWTLTRISLIRQGELKHLFAFLRDLFYLLRAPKIDQLTFISRRDALKEKHWWQNKITPHVLPNFGLDREVQPSNDIRFVFVGDGNYGPNKKAIAFLRNTLSHLPEAIRIHLYGKDLNYSDPRFVSHGYAKDNHFYFANDVHLAPIRSGAGIKMKVATPLWNGLRVIATVEGANGLSACSTLQIGSSPKDFAQQIQRMLVENSSPNAEISGFKIYAENQSEEVLGWLESISHRSFRDDQTNT